MKPTWRDEMSRSIPSRDPAGLMPSIAQALAASAIEISSADSDEGGQ